MMQRFCASVVMTLVTVSVSAQPQLLRLLSPLDVLEVTKVKGVKTVEKNPTTGASGDLNFADGEGELLLLMTVQPKAEFQLIKRTVAAPVAGVGEEAYQAPNAAASGGMPPFMLVFRKGDSAVTLTSMFTAKGTPRVSQAQMKQLAVLIASKL